MLPAIYYPPGGFPMFDALWWMKGYEFWRARGYNPDQERDELGRFAGSGGGASSFASDRMFTKDELALPAKTRQTVKTKDELYEQAKKAMPAFDASLNHGEGVDKALGANVVRPGNKEDFHAAINSPGPTVMIAGLKGQERAGEKVANKYEGDWSRLTDVVRATVAVDSKDDIPKAVAALRTEMEAKGWSMAAAPDNRMETPLPSGYRDINMLFKSPEGHVAEVQVNTKAMIRAKEGGHKLYEEYRSLAEPIKATGREPTAEEHATLSALDAKMNATFAKAWKES